MAKNILICDDAAFMRMMIKDILTKNGYNVVGEAENFEPPRQRFFNIFVLAPGRVAAASGMRVVVCGHFLIPFDSMKS